MLAHALAERGIETALIPLYDQAIDVPLLDLDGVIVNFAREVNRPLVAAYRAAGLPVWVLDTEGGVLAESGGNAPDALAAYIRTSGYADLLTGYFFWGPVLREAFVADSGMRADSLHVTGCPRFDFAATRWRSLLGSAHVGHILFNANFSLVNPRFARSPDEEVAALTANGWAEDYVRALIADMKQVLTDFLDVVTTTASRHPQRSFLVRPHPFENDQLYRDRFAACPNVVVDGNGSVLDVIARAAAVIHLNCGTAIEAVLLGRLPVSMEFLNRDTTRRHATLPSRVSRGVHSLDELTDLLDRLEHETAAFDFDARHHDNIAPWFHLNDGQAADRIAAILDEAVTAHRSSTRLNDLGRSIRNMRARPSLGQTLQGLAANIMGSRRSSGLRARFQRRRHDKRFTSAAVQPTIASLAATGGKPAAAVGQARHPLTGLALGSVLIRPQP